MLGTLVVIFNKGFRIGTQLKRKHVGAILLAPSTGNYNFLVSMIRIVLLFCKHINISEVEMDASILLSLLVRL